MRNTALLMSGLFLLTALLPLGGCGEPTARPTVSEKKPKGCIIGVSLAGLDSPWREQIKADIEAEAAKHPDLRLMLKDARNNVTQQASQLDALLKNRVNAVIVNPMEAHAMTEPVARLFDAGIPVVVLDQPVIGAKYTCLIAADPREIGAAAGAWLAERLAGKGKIVEIEGPVDSLWADALFDAWRDVLRDPGFRFVFDGRVDPPRKDAGKLMAEAIDDVDQFDVVFAYNDAAARAAYETAKTTGREKGVLFVGVGGLPTQGATYVAEGILAATFLKPTGGAQAVDAVVKLLDGQKVPKKIVPPMEIIAAEHSQ